jgi:hypothetical protein
VFSVSSPVNARTKQDYLKNPALYERLETTVLEPPKRRKTKLSVILLLLLCSPLTHFLGYNLFPRWAPVVKLDMYLTYGQSILRNPFLG